MTEAVCDRMGPVISELRQKGWTMVAIAREYGMSPHRVHSFYNNWKKREQLRAEGLPLKRENSQQKQRNDEVGDRLGPIFQAMKESGLTWIDIGKQHQMTSDAARGIYRRWVRRSLKSQPSQSQSPSPASSSSALHRCPGTPR